MTEDINDIKSWKRSEAMRLPGENDDIGAKLSAKYVVIGVSLSALLILGVVFFAKQEQASSAKLRAEKAQNTTVMAVEHGDSSVTGDSAPVASEGEQDLAVNGSASRMRNIERLYEENKLTASDLDFWDMYPNDEPKSVSGSEDETSELKDLGDAQTEGDKYSQYDREQQELPENDGKHTLITYANGSEEWVLINPYLEKNIYDFTNLTMKSDKMAYYQEGKSVSYLGADVSKYNEEIDFASLKGAGIDFVMIRLGARGYGSGQIVLDEKFADNIVKASEAGLDIGIYFFSQAITSDEAIEEANFVIQNLQNLSNYKITYPIAFDMEYVKNDTARIEALSRDQKTTIAKAFLDTIKNAGYKPMVYGTKEWLIKQVDLTKLTGYDIWLSQQEDVPDYPYQFQMWQYTLEGKVSGITGDIDLNISFIDYSEK
ncbi:glycoside hydrolase family 25 protein [Kineothrix sedimenti]|uniref:Glycoside hydrolase family 25 protein n=1 Tax=Kineothrix sedimenti TaxID=3123317 RepID=A0ABZ3F491_9FIRM